MQHHAASIPEPVPLLPTIAYTYDPRGNLVSATVDGVSTNLYAYDVFGNLTNEVQNGTGKKWGQTPVFHYYGGSGDCPPDELLRSTNSELRASVSWTATAGASAFSGDGTKRGQTRMILGGIVCCYYYNVKIVAEIRDRFDFVPDRPGGRIKDRIYNGAAKIWSQIYNKWLGASSPDVELDINERFEKSGCY